MGLEMEVDTEVPSNNAGKPTWSIHNGTPLFLIIFNRTFRNKRFCMLRFQCIPIYNIEIIGKRTKVTTD